MKMFSARDHRNREEREITEQKRGPLTLHKIIFVCCKGEKCFSGKRNTRSVKKEREQHEEKK